MEPARSLNQRLDIGKMGDLLNLRSDALDDFLNARGLVVSMIRDVVSEVRENRNQAVHERRPYWRAEANHIRERWLRGTVQQKSIFAVLLGNTASEAGS